MTAADRPAVPAGTRVYAIGDCHGCAERLRALHAAIRDDAAAADAAQPARRRVAVYVGDYIDRGPDSRGVIEHLLEAPLPGFETVYLMGNHEAMMLDAPRGAEALMVWLMNGGDATARSYGIDVFELYRAGDRAAGLRAELERRVPDSHRRFLGALRLSHVEGDYLFVHAGIRPGVPLEAQAADDLLWIREPFLASTADHGKVVVHGHTPTHAPEIRPNRIGIDTGAVFGGPLTALVLEGEARRILQA